MKSKWEVRPFMQKILQDSPEGELRIVQRIKTHLGIWDWFEESENYKGTQRDDIDN